MADLEQEKLTYHLSELRKTILSVIVCLIVLFPLGYFFAPYCIDWLIKRSFLNQSLSLNFFSPMEVFIVNLKIGFVVAFIMGFPYIIYKIWQFLLPALYDKEKKFIKTAVFCSSILFIFGAAICVAFVLPLIIKFSMSFTTEQIKPMLGISNFLGLSGWLMLVFGLMFQFPIVIYFLVKFSIVSVETLKNKRPYIIVVMLLIAA
ncbi:twin-arginine translocase subunit TatC, partial [Candidatus Ruminimicrobium bovinum]|uniref:twin-arginine translocase subunit TatC n=1 Tax=Candidatus Ruminimicrobium bovinum TaxID=3242779 RepID=UPI0039B9862A